MDAVAPFGRQAQNLLHPLQRVRQQLHLLSEPVAVVGVPHQHLAEAQKTQHVIPEPGRQQGRPAGQLLHLLAGRLGTGQVAHPQRQLPRRPQVGNRTVQLGRGGHAAGVDDAGNPPAGQLAQVLSGAGQLLIPRGPGNAGAQVREGAPVTGDKPRQPSGRIPHQPTLGRVGAVRGQPQGQKRPAVQHRVLAQVLHVDGVLRSHLVQFLGGGAAALPKLVLVPAAPHHDPRSRWAAPGHLGDEPKPLLQARHRGPAELRTVGQAGQKPVGVAVDEPRDDRAPTHVHHPGFRPDPAQHLPVASHGHDEPVPHGEGLGDAGAGVQGDHLAVEQHQVGRVVGRRGGRRRQGRRCGGMPGTAGPARSRRQRQQRP